VGSIGTKLRHRWNFLNKYKYSSTSIINLPFEFWDPQRNAGFSLLGHSNWNRGTLGAAEYNHKNRDSECNEPPDPLELFIHYNPNVYILIPSSLH
jgi:hypothetical protein